MPYTIEERRALVNHHIIGIENIIRNKNLPPKEMISYIITKLMKDIVKENKCYDTMSDMVGAVFCTILEYYTTDFREYEDIKRRENGDIQ